LEALPHFHHVADLGEAYRTANRGEGAGQGHFIDEGDAAFLENADFKSQHGDDLGVLWNVVAVTRDFNAGSANYSCQNFATAALPIGNSAMLPAAIVNIRRPA
jgi:hypothetical protein